MIHDYSGIILSPIKKLAKAGINVGVTNQLLAGLSTNNTVPFGTFSSIEWNTNLQTLIGEATLHKLISSGIQSVFVHLDLTARDINTGRLETENWKNFIFQLQENVRSEQKYTVIFSLDRNTIYEQAILDRILQFRDDLYPVRLSIASKHRSWGNPQALKSIKQTRLNTVIQDVPLLSGFDFRLPNLDNKYAYLRLLGRNQNDWFAKDKEQKYKYDYTKVELVELAERVLKLREEHDEVNVIAAHRPPNTALSNLVELSHILVKK